MKAGHAKPLALHQSQDKDIRDGTTDNEVHYFSTCPSHQEGLPLLVYLYRETGLERESYSFDMRCYPNYTKWE